MMCRREALALAPPGALLLVNGRVVRSTGRVHRFGSGWVVPVIGAPPGYALCPLDDTVPAPPMPCPVGDEGDTLTDAPEVDEEGDTLTDAPEVESGGVDGPASNLP